VDMDEFVGFKLRIVTGFQIISKIGRLYCNGVHIISEMAWLRMATGVLMVSKMAGHCKGNS